MAEQRRVRLMRPEPMPINYKYGRPLYPSVRLQAQYQDEWGQIVQEMYDTAFEALQGFEGSDDGVTMDAVDGPTIWVVIQRLRALLEDRFEAIAARIGMQMVTDVDRNAATTLRRSLREIAPNYTVRFHDAQVVKDQFRDQIEENVRLIRRIPREYMDAVVEDVQKAVLEGDGTRDIANIMSKRYGTMQRWARQVALDQTNKAYKVINSNRMREAGLRKFRWIHTSVPKKPREYHKLSHSAGGLNGGIFDLDKPPIINLETGQRGLPGDEIFCHCIMQPVVEM